MNATPTQDSAAQPGPAQIDAIITQAASWHLVFADNAMTKEDMDWDGFTAWLEADPRHARAYDEIAVADAWVSEHGDNLFVDEEEIHPRPRKRGGLLGLGAVAAAVLAMLAVPALRPSHDVNYVTGDAPRAIALADGSAVTLAPHSSLALSGPANMRLTGGAWFDVRHIAGRKMAITAGQVTISDIGTRFDVQAAGGEGAGVVRVAVADGALQVGSPALSQPIALGKGHLLLYDEAGDIASTRAIATAQIGGWRRGRLTYENMPLALVAEDIGRYANVHIAVPEDLRRRTFSGTLIIGKGQSAPRDLAQLMGLALVGKPGGLGPDGLRLRVHGGRAN